jgi:hypothetical protein
MAGKRRNVAKPRGHKKKQVRGERQLPKSSKAAAAATAEKAQLSETARRSPPAANARMAEQAADRFSDRPNALAALIEEERGHLMEVRAMLKCLYEVLLYADGNDSIEYADVANVAARLIEDCVERLEKLVARINAEVGSSG